MSVVANLLDRARAATAAANEIGLAFVLAEIDLGLNFGHLALRAEAPGRRQGSELLARQALSVAHIHASQLKLTRDEQRVVGERLTALQSTIEDLAVIAAANRDRSVDKVQPSRVVTEKPRKNSTPTAPTRG